MKEYIGMFCFTVTIAAVFVNSSLMLISPKLWFRMPTWMRLSNLPEAKFRGGWGGIQVRLLGAIFLAVIIWFAHGFIYNHR
jgi:integral membrane sensor domain MASE1